MWQTYITPATIEDALELLESHLPDARVISGGTDVMREIDSGVSAPSVIIDVGRIEESDEIALADDGMIHIGPNVTHHQFASSALGQDLAFPLAQGCLQVGSPQIRNRGTIAGNVMTASPAADTVPALSVLGAQIVLRSKARGQRTVRLEDFFLDLRQIAAEPDELIVDILINPMQGNERGCFIKLADRQAMGISVVSLALRIGFDGKDRVARAAIALGSVAPTVVRGTEAEDYLRGKALTNEVVARAAELVTRDIKPITDIRGSADYRRWMVEALIRRGLELVQAGMEKADWPEAIPLLSIPHERTPLPSGGYVHKLGDEAPIVLRVNGEEHRVSGASGKSLLHLIREDLGLAGTKKGCGEGRCGACTVLLNGQAVMSCLVPAPCAHQSEVLTVEGLAENGKLSAVQQAFVEKGAVQCGYCTPGFLMSSHALVTESQTLSRDTIAYALAGNLCRCTGYKRIILAVESAAEAPQNARPKDK